MRCTSDAGCGDHAREEGFDRDVEFGEARGCDAESGDVRVDGVVGWESMNSSMSSL